MAAHTASVPRENELLCESCGYGLTGLPESGACPECGAAVTLSTTADGRTDPPWEQRPSPAAFWATTARLIVTPAAFFRGLRTRRPSPLSRWFAGIHQLLASSLLGGAAAVHLLFIWDSGGGWMLPGAWRSPLTSAFAWPFLTVLIFGLTHGTVWLAGRLSAWEAGYHGMRLPLAVVNRGLDYHAAHLLPVAVAALGTVVTYRILRETRTLPPGSGMPYLYTLCGQVVLSAGYLFWTYWAAMKNMMWANR